MTLKIRNPAASDITELLPLWKEQFTLHHAFDPEYYVECTPLTMRTIERHIKRLIAKSVTEMLIAVSDGTIAGFICFKDNKTAYVDTNIRIYADIIELFVSEQFRRRGVGKKLIQEMEKVLAERGVYYTQLGCAANNEAGIKFYTKMGYRGNHIWFIKKSRLHP